MGRIRKKCRIEGCSGMGRSNGIKRGKPFWETLCNSHKRKFAKEKSEDLKEQ